VKFLGHLDATLVKEPGVSIPIVLDNYATHKTPSVKRWLLRHPEYRLHFIPTSSSWLNQIERFFAAITEKRIRRGAFAGHTGPGRGNLRIHRGAQRGSKAVQLGRERGCHPRSDQEGL
jgi:DDE superfamily endonuclease